MTRCLRNVGHFDPRAFSETCHDILAMMDPSDARTNSYDFAGSLSAGNKGHFVTNLISACNLQQIDKLNTACTKPKLEFSGSRRMRIWHSPDLN